MSNKSSTDMTIKVTISKPNIDAHVAAVLSGKITHLTDWEVIVAVASYCEENNIPIEFVRFDENDKVLRMNAEAILDADEVEVDLRG